MKKIQTAVDKKASVIAWQTGVQLYRAFKSIDLAHYDCAWQGELTVCGARGGEFAEIEKANCKGSQFLVRNGKLGAVTMRGVLVDNGNAFQAGKFALRVVKGDNVFNSLKELVAFVAKEGEKGELLHKAFAGCQALIGTKISFVVRNGKLARFERNTAGKDGDDLRGSRYNVEHVKKLLGIK